MVALLTQFRAAAMTSSPTRTNWMIFPTDPWSEGRPRDTSPPSRAKMPRVSATPAVTATATPSRNAWDTPRRRVTE